MVILIWPPDNHREWLFGLKPDADITEAMVSYDPKLRSLDNSNHMLQLVIKPHGLEVNRRLQNCAPQNSAGKTEVDLCVCIRSLSMLIHYVGVLIK